LVAQNTYFVTSFWIFSPIFKVTYYVLIPQSSSKKISFARKLTV
jgi:hypothetical protein